MEHRKRVLQNLFHSKKYLLETVNGFRFRRFLGLFWSIFDPKDGLKRTQKSTETKFVNSLLAFVPLIVITLYLQRENDRLQGLATQVNGLEKKAVALSEKKAREEKVWNLCQHSPSRYLSDAIESMTLLSLETKKVEAMTRHTPQNRVLQDRLTFLQGDKNRIKFVEQTHRLGPFFQETELTFQHRVQMDQNDLRNFLVAVEGDGYSAIEGRPLLVIKEFELGLKKESADEKVYDVHVELIRRAP